MVAVLLNLFFNVLRPGTPQEPTDVAAAPATMVREDEAEVLAAGGHFESGAAVRPDDGARSAELADSGSNRRSGDGS